MTPLPSGPAPSVTTIISETASEQNKKKLEMWSRIIQGKRKGSRKRYSYTLWNGAIFKR